MKMKNRLDKMVYARFNNFLQSDGLTISVIVPHENQ